MSNCNEIYILGAGSIGCLFTYFLNKHGNNTIIITRNEDDNINKSNSTSLLTVESKIDGSKTKIECHTKSANQIINENLKIKVIINF